METISLSQFGRDSTPPSQPNWTFDGHAWHIWKMGRDHSWCVSLPISIIDDEKKDKDSSSYRTYLFDFDYSLFEGLLMKVIKNGIHFLVFQIMSKKKEKENSAI